MAIAERGRATNSIVDARDKGGTGARQTLTVPLLRLDDLLDSTPPPTIVKIDVEGAELGVLQGMTETIRRFKPVLIYEVDDGDRDAFERRWTALDDFVRGLGYNVRRLESSYPNLKWHVGHSVASWRSDVKPASRVANVAG